MCNGLAHLYDEGGWCEQGILNLWCEIPEQNHFTSWVCIFFEFEKSIGGVEAGQNSTLVHCSVWTADMGQC